MFRVAVLFACLALCHGGAVLPVLAPVPHAAVVAPVVPVVPGYAGHGLAGVGYAGAGYGVGYGPALVGAGYSHHVLKRSPSLVAPVGHIAPVAVSHQSRVDLSHYGSSVVHGAGVPLIKPVVGPAVYPAQGFVAGHGYY